MFQKHIIGKPVTGVASGAFAFSNSILKVNFTENITEIGSHAFMNCNQIQELTIEKNVSSIGHEAFLNCTGVKKIIFKNSMKSYAYGAFNGVSSWTEIEIDDGNTAYSVEDNILYSKDMKELILCPRGRTDSPIISSTTQIIQSGAFSCCIINSIILPENIISLYDSAFRSSSIKEITIGENITHISPLRFYACNSLKTVTINSASVASQITNAYSNSSGEAGTEGNLVAVADTIYIRDDITEIGSYITNNYQITESNKEGYVKYVKK